MEKNRLEQWLNELRKKGVSPYVIGIAATLVVWLVGAALLFVVTRPSAPKPEVPQQENPQQEIPVLETGKHPLDGLALPEENAAIAPVYAVMIDNIVDARPQAGLNKASLVIEAPVESGITRFMAVFRADQEVAKIGPVRSARPYFVDLAHELQAYYLHVGGSPDALEQLAAETKVKNIDEFSHSTTFYRAKNRYAPHNAYTSSALVNKILKPEAQSFAAWNFRDEVPAEERKERKGVKIAFSTPTNEAEWRYDAVKNVYTRFQGRARHKDENGEEITAKNVVVMLTEEEVLDTAGRKSIRTTGTGEAWIYQEGALIKGRWIKETLDSRLTFTKEDGTQIPMVRGNTWVEIATSRSSITEL